VTGNIPMLFFLERFYTRPMVKNILSGWKAGARK
jgi:hypothetical protein